MKRNTAIGRQAGRQTDPHKGEVGASEKERETEKEKKRHRAR